MDNCLQIVIEMSHHPAVLPNRVAAIFTELINNINSNRTPITDIL